MRRSRKPSMRNKVKTLRRPIRVDRKRLSCVPPAVDGRRQAGRSPRRRGKHPGGRRVGALLGVALREPAPVAAVGAAQPAGLAHRLLVHLQRKTEGKKHHKRRLGDEVLIAKRLATQGCLTDGLWWRDANRSVGGAGCKLLCLHGGDNSAALLGR